MPTYLADIIAAHRARAEADSRALPDLVEQAAATPPPRDFMGALQSDGLTCIAEIKRRSPSKGDLDPGLQPDLVAKDYVTGGASCLSVLTDVDFFGGSVADLAAARQAGVGLAAGERSWAPGRALRRLRLGVFRPRSARQRIAVHARNGQRPFVTIGPSP